MRNSRLPASMIAGFSLLCFVNVVCFFPDALAPNASPFAWRVYNIAHRVSMFATALTWAFIAAKAPAKAFPVAAIGGHLLTGLGCALAFARAATLSQGDAIAAGILCGAGLAFSMSFWFSMLFFIPDRRQAFVQGVQALLGEGLFLAFAFLAPNGIAASTLAALFGSATCVVFTWRCIRKIQTDPFPARTQRQSATTIENAFSGSAHFPLVGFLVISFLYGAVDGVAMGPHGSPLGAQMSAFGAPIGALAFLIWARLSKRRCYETAVEGLFLLFAFALLPSSLDLIAFLASMGFQLCGLLLFSAIINRLSRDHRSGVCAISAIYGVVQILFLAGLYVPAILGVKTYEAFLDSSSLLLLFVYLVFASLLLLARKAHNNQRENMEKAFHEQEEEGRILKEAVFDGNEKLDVACSLASAKYGLTKRESEVLAYLARGRDAAFICNELVLARDTVKGYMKRIYAKMGVHSKQEVINVIEATMLGTDEDLSSTFR